MIAPRKIKFEANKKRNENYEFRSYLKENAEEKELDEQFQKLHKELFAGYDCGRCRNCCKMYHGQSRKRLLPGMRTIWDYTKEQFIAKYLMEKTRKRTTRPKIHPVISWERTETVCWATADRKTVGNIVYRPTRQMGKSLQRAGCD